MLAQLCSTLLVPIALEAAEEGDLGATLTFHLPLRLTALWHESSALQDRIQVHLGLVIVAMSKQALISKRRVVCEKLGNGANEGAHARKEHADARLRELLRGNVLDIDAVLPQDATLGVDIPLSHVWRCICSRAIASSRRRRPSAPLGLVERPAAQCHLDEQRHAKVLLSLGEHLCTRRSSVSDALSALRCAGCLRTWRGAPIGAKPLLLSLANFSPLLSYTYL
eukprot:944901-Prymnesium_polylepis.2